MKSFLSTLRTWWKKMWCEHEYYDIYLKNGQMYEKYYFGDFKWIDYVKCRSCHEVVSWKNYKEQSLI